MLAAVILVPLGVLALTSGSDGGEEAREGSLLVETFPNPQTGSLEVVVSLEDAGLNRPETVGGRDKVGLECHDAAGRIVLSGEHRWPLDNDFGTELPHAHQPVASDKVQEIASCRLRGTTAKLEGRVTNRPGT